MPVRREMLWGAASLLLVGLFAGLQISTWPARLSYPGEQNDEGIAFFETLHLRRGVPIYAQPSPGRFDGAVYGPLYYLLGARLIDPEEPTYFPLRLLSVLGTLGCAACSGLLAFWLTRRRRAAVMAPLVFLSYGFVARFGTSARCDVVALFLVFLGFVLAYRYFERRQLFLAIPIMLLGLFYKQQFVVGPLAVVLTLVLTKQYRRAGLFVGLFGLGGLALLGVFQFVVFPRQAFLDHFVSYNAAGASWTQFKYAGLMYLGIVLLVPIILGLEFLRTHPSRLLLCYLSLSVVVSLLTAARVGSDTNYWFEPVLILSTLVAGLVAERSDGPRRAPEVVFLLGITLFLARFFTPPGPQPKDFEADRAVQAYLRRTFPRGTPALSHYAGTLGRAGLDLPISNLDQYRFLLAQGKLPEREVPAELDQCRFKVILLNFELGPAENPRPNISDIPESWVRAILANYRLAASLDMPDTEKVRPDDRFYVWVPRRNRPDSGAGAHR
ncbi:MAG: hypothetical protein LAO07_04720 [Acidobacteriia bacterium]|nr:hypothetical protein [Terriglobia bacterium]